MPHLNVYGPDAFISDTEYEVWLDPADGPGDLFQGVRLAAGPTQEVALRQALEETQRVGHELDAMLRQHLQGHA